MNDATTDVADGETMGPVDRTKLLKQLLKQAENPENPFDVRAVAVHSIRVELPSVPEVEAYDEAYQEAVRARESAPDSYRGYVAGLSPKSKGGQQQLQRFRTAVLAALKPPKAPKDPKAPSERKKKAADKPCICGCGTLVHNLFASGHDAKVHSLMLRVSRGLAPESEISELTRPHLKDLAIRWKMPTDGDGNLVVIPPAPKAPTPAG